MALSCVLLALAGHVLGGGSATPVLPILVVGAPLGGAFVVWADRQRGIRELACAALGSQLAFHAVFLLCDDVGAMARSSTWGVHMVLGHGFAALGMVWVLSRGEAALWNLYRGPAAPSCFPAARAGLRRPPGVEVRRDCGARRMRHGSAGGVDGGLTGSAAHSRGLTSGTTDCIRVRRRADLLFASESRKAWWCRTAPSRG
jgi:hypothetical protein